MDLKYLRKRAVNIFYKLCLIYVKNPYLVAVKNAETLIKSTLTKIFIQVIMQ